MMYAWRKERNYSINRQSGSDTKAHEISIISSRKDSWLRSRVELASNVELKKVEVEKTLLFANKKEKEETLTNTLPFGDESL